MKALLVTSAIFAVVTLGWVMLRMSRWSAPLSGTVGLVLAVLGAYANAASLMAFGGGLFLFSTLLFVLGSGRAGL